MGLGRDTKLFYLAQCLFGGWFLFHGLNYWLDFFPQSGAGSHGLIGALMESGLFDWVKAVEVVVGIALLANRFVPLAIVVGVPITLVIAYLNLVMRGDLKGWIVGITILVVHGTTALGHVGRYLPMLVADAGDPAISPIGSKATLAGSKQALAILFGIAIPAAITYASLLFEK